MLECASIKGVEASSQMPWKPGDPEDDGDGEGWLGHTPEKGRLWEVFGVGHTTDWKPKQGCGLGNERKPAAERHEPLGREQRQEVKGRKPWC